MKIIVLMGGTSPEKEVSLKSGNNVLNALKNKGYNAEGFIFDGNNMNALLRSEPDMIFNIIHGGEGEDGRLSSFFEMMRIPYVGSSPYTQSITMYKHITQTLLKSWGFTIPYFKVIRREQDIHPTFKTIFKRYSKVIIKPTAQGSSVGVMITDDPEKAVTFSKNAIGKYGILIVEAFIDGTEITCGLIGHYPRIKAFTLMEIRAKREFYNYEAKYTEGATDFIVPAEIEEKISKKIRSQAKKIYRLFELRDFARIDCICSRGRIYWHDINTIPGMTELSDLPQVAEYDGMKYADLCVNILKDAIKRYEK